MLYCMYYTLPLDANLSGLCTLLGGMMYFAEQGCNSQGSAEHDFAGGSSAKDTENDVSCGLVTVDPITGHAWATWGLNEH